ncbi:MAG TPA: hypothetical protein VK939_08510, partial [Longimicrobiales bacterium]|nr:hypothetical protein [Longimicrobiales bacterium]
AAKAARQREARRSKDEPKPPVDLSVELVDAQGERASVPLSRYGAIRRPLEMRILRRADREKQFLPRNYELVLQSFSVPLRDFTAANPALDPAALRSVRLVFDRAVAGTVIVDDIGFAKLEAAYWD